jgi:hypothetical protein
LTAIAALALVLPIDSAVPQRARAAVGCSLLTALPTDIVADGFEITQSIQDGRNRVPLVAGKRTYVRLYGHIPGIEISPPVIGSPTNAKKGLPGGSCTSEALLTVRSGSTTVTLEPLGPDGLDTISVHRVNRFRRSDPNYGFLFELPSFATRGLVGLTAEFNPNGTISESDRSNNSIQAVVQFRPVPRLNIKFDRVSYTVGTSSQDTALSEIAQLVRWMQRAFPIPGIDWRANALNWGNATVDTGGNLTNPTCDDLNARRFLAEFGFFDFDEYYETEASNRRFYAMVDDTLGFMFGCALLDENPFGPIASGPTGTPKSGTAWAWDTDGSYGDWYGAHEIGHTLRRKHVVCVGTEGGAGPYPYPNGLISPQSSDADAIVGFDVETRETYPFNKARDVMSYSNAVCSPEWVSDFTYKGLLNQIVDNAPDVVPPGGFGDGICVVGVLGKGKGSPAETRLQPAFRNPETVFDVVKKRGRGKYAIELRDAGGNLLERHRFKPTRSGPGSGYGGIGERVKPTLVVSECLPFVVGTAQVTVTGPGKEPLGTIAPGASMPTVEVFPPDVTAATPTPIPQTPTPTVSPVATPTPTPSVILSAGAARAATPAFGSSIHLEWAASDPDGDTLTHLVQASADDGRTWTTVALPTTETAADIPRDNLAGTNIRFRVVTSDGLNTVFDILDDLVFAPLVDPLLELRLPAAVPGIRSIRSRQTLALEAFAYDPVRGNLDGSAVTWRSSKDGVLGNGDQLSVTGLTPGDHIITVDADGAFGRASRSISLVVE